MSTRLPEVKPDIDGAIKYPTDEIVVAAGYGVPICIECGEELNPLLHCAECGAVYDAEDVCYWRPEARL